MTQTPETPQTPPSPGRHQFSAVLDSLADGLKDAADLNPVFLTPGQAGATLVALARISA